MTKITKLYKKITIIWHNSNFYYCTILQAQYSQTNYVGKATARLTDNGVIFTVPTKDANGNYYNYYRIRYFLAIKDAFWISKISFLNCFNVRSKLTIPLTPWLIRDS